MASAAVAACTLTTDLSGFVTRDAPEGGEPDASTVEGGQPDGSVDAGVDGGGDVAVADAGEGFFDDFARPDDDALGNGWIEKLPATFVLEGGAVRKLATPSTSYRDNMVYRPASEDRRDVEASIEMSIELPVAYPQIFVRAQRSTIAKPSEYDGYLLYIENSRTTAKLGRQHGTPFVVTLATLTISPELDPAMRYRLRLAARGTSPVKLDAFIERRDTAGWTVDAEAHVDDAAAVRIEQAGAVGFAANEVATPVYDNFAWRALDAP